MKNKKGLSVGEILIGILLIVLAIIVGMGLVILQNALGLGVFAIIKYSSVQLKTLPKLNDKYD